MTHSMTGFATSQGGSATATWLWDIRSVNGKGLDLRLRLPDWIDGIEAAVRTALQGKIARGSVTVSLRVAAEGTAGAAALNESALGGMLDAMARIEAEAMARGLSLAPSTAAEIASLRGILETSADMPVAAAIRDAAMADLPAVLDAFLAMRAEEGAAIGAMLDGHLDEIARLVAAARTTAASRAEDQRARMAQQLARVTENADAADPDRVAQELALIAVKADVTEEIDRLEAHVAAARKHLRDPEPVGRKLDFLMQEFNREANTLCAKAGSAPLTEVGLALKTVIDRMREQVQNVE